MKVARTLQDIGKLLKYHRRLQELSQTELASRAGVHQSAISNLEKGVGGSLETVEALMAVLKLELNFQPIRALDTSKLSKLVD